MFICRLTFEFDPSSRVHKFHAHHLKPGGGMEEVTLDNVEEYIDLVMDFCFVSGIRRQMEAFRSKYILETREAVFTEILIICPYRGAVRFCMLLRHLENMLNFLKSTIKTHVTNSRSFADSVFSITNITPNSSRKNGHC